MNQSTLYTLYGFGRFYQKIKPVLKKNKNACCEICKTNEKLTVHHVLPRFFGAKIDKETFLQCRTVVVCQKHHNEYEIFVEQLKDELAVHYNFNFRGPEMIEDPELLKIRTYARSLICGMNMQTQEREIYKRIDVILSFLGQPSYTSNDLHKLSEMNVLKQNPLYKNLADFMYELHGGFEGVKEFLYNHWDNYVEKRTCFIG